MSGFASEADERVALGERIARLAPSFAEDWQTASMASLRFTAQSLEEADADRRRYGGSAARFRDDPGLTADD